MFGKGRAKEKEGINFESCKYIASYIYLIFSNPSIFCYMAQLLGACLKRGNLLHRKPGQ